MDGLSVFITNFDSSGVYMSLVNDQHKKVRRRFTAVFSAVTTKVRHE